MSTPKLLHYGLLDALPQCGAYRDYDDDEEEEADGSIVRVEDNDGCTRNGKWGSPEDFPLSPSPDQWSMALGLAGTAAGASAVVAAVSLVVHPAALAAAAGSAVAISSCAPTSLGEDDLDVAEEEVAVVNDGDSYDDFSGNGKAVQKGGTGEEGPGEGFTATMGGEVQSEGRDEESLSRGNLTAFDRAGETSIRDEEEKEETDVHRCAAMTSDAPSDVRSNFPPPPITGPPTSTPSSYASLPMALPSPPPTPPPPLRCVVLNDVPFPSFVPSAGSFFRLFLADSAPRCLSAFHESRGDRDVRFQPWRRSSSSRSASTGISGRNGERGGMTTMRRTLTFRKRNRAPFGPAYASATRTQTASLFCPPSSSRDCDRARATTTSASTLILESRTDVDGVPYSDKFHVLERWVVRSTADPAGGVAGGGDGRAAAKTRTTTTAKTTLAVSAEVVFSSWCALESKIRSASIGGVTEFVSSWYEQAREVSEGAREPSTEDEEKEVAIVNPSGEGGTEHNPADKIHFERARATNDGYDDGPSCSISRLNASAKAGSSWDEAGKREALLSVAATASEETASVSSSEESTRSVVLARAEGAVLDVSAAAFRKGDGGRRAKALGPRYMRKLKKKCSKIRDRVC